MHQKMKFRQSVARWRAGQSALMLRMAIPVLVTMALAPIHAHGQQADNEGDNRMTLVMSAPRSDDSFYWRIYDRVLQYQLGLARQVLKHDRVVIYTDTNGYEFFAKHLPDDVLINRPLEDIWLRDFAPVKPQKPLRFRYTAAGQNGDQRVAGEVQRQFSRVIRSQRLTTDKARYLLDGGNIVSDGTGKVVVTERFLKDNLISRERGIAILKRVLKAAQVAIIEPDDPDGLAHAGRMVMFADTNTLFVNANREPLRSKVLRELRRAFPAVKLIEIPLRRDNRIQDPDFPSSCGIYVNATVTNRAIYLPQFGTNLDARVLSLVRKHTKKEVVPVSAKNSCFIGTSPRRLTWRQIGRNAAYLQRAARAERR